MFLCAIKQMLILNINVHNKININININRQMPFKLILFIFSFFGFYSTYFSIFFYFYFFRIFSLLQFLLSLLSFPSPFYFDSSSFVKKLKKLLFTVSSLQIIAIKDSRFHTLRSLLFRPPPSSLAVFFSPPVVPTYPSRSKYKAILGLVRCKRQGQTILISLNSSPHILHFRTFLLSSLYLIFPHAYV